MSEHITKKKKRQPKLNISASNEAKPAVPQGQRMEVKCREVWKQYEMQHQNSKASFLGLISNLISYV